MANPGEATREALIADAFGGHRATESLRARLRVEVGRLRRLLAPLAEIRATPRGFTLTPRSRIAVHVRLPPAEGEASPLLALLGGGPWPRARSGSRCATTARHSRASADQVR